MISYDLEGHLLCNDPSNFMCIIRVVPLRLSAVLPHAAFTDLTDANSDECLSTSFTEGSGKHPKAGPRAQEAGTSYTSFPCTLILPCLPFKGGGAQEGIEDSF